MKHLNLYILILLMLDCSLVRASEIGFYELLSEEQASREKVENEEIDAFGYVKSRPDFAVDSILSARSICEHVPTVVADADGTPRSQVITVHRSVLVKLAPKDGKRLRVFTESHRGKSFLVKVGDKFLAKQIVVAAVEHGRFSIACYSEQHQKELLALLRDISKTSKGH